MKKRLALVMVSIMLLTGCGISEGKRDDIINKLEDEDMEDNYDYSDDSKFTTYKVRDKRFLIFNYYKVEKEED